MANTIDHTAARGVWVRTHFYQKGPILHSVTYMVAAGQPEVFRFSLDLRPIMKRLKRVHTRWHKEDAPKVGWFPANIVKKVARAIGKSKIVKSIAKAGKAIVRSKITGGILAATAVAFPAVGAPALAAYAGANKALDMIEQGNKAAKAVKKFVSGKKTVRLAKRVVKKYGSRKAGGMFRRIRGMVKKIKKAKARVSAGRKLGFTRRLVPKIKASSVAIQRMAAIQRLSRFGNPAQRKKARAQLAFLRKLAARKKTTTKRAVRRRPPRLRASIKSKARKSSSSLKAAKALAQRKAAWAKIAKVAHIAKHGTGAKKLEAQKAIAVMKRVAKNRSTLRNVGAAHRGGLPGLLIDRRGRLTRGKFARNAGTDALLYNPSGSLKGRFARIGDDPEIHIPYYTFDRATDVFGLDADDLIGCVGQEANALLSGENAVDMLVGCAVGQEGRATDLWGEDAAEYVIGGEYDIVGDFDVRKLRLIARRMQARRKKLRFKQKGKLRALVASGATPTQIRRIRDRMMAHRAEVRSIQQSRLAELRA